MYLNVSHKQQRGFLIPLSIFIVVVMGLFALVLMRTTTQTTTSATQEMVSVQAFYAAESGAQTAMQVLFYPDPNLRSAVDARCVSLNNTYNYNVSGLKNCSVVVSCSCTYQDAGSCTPATAANYSASALSEKLTSFYKVSSAATCGGGNLRAVRTIEAGSFLKQE